MKLVYQGIKESLFRSINLMYPQLHPEAMLAQAEKITSLSDWGGLDFYEPYRCLLTALRQEAGLSHQGMFILRRHYLRLLCNILKIVNDWKHFPEIGDVSIQAPIVILGFPRTGTTYLHQLLSLDPTSRALRYWELLFPSPPVQPNGQYPDPRIRKAKLFTYMINKLSPKLSTIHALEATGVEECCFIFDHYFLDNMNHLVFDVPSYMEWYDRHDALSSYLFHRKMLRTYGWKFSFDRFVLKAPRHLFCLSTLLRVYPDARIVWTHRDPVNALASLCSLSETARRIVSDSIDKRRIGQLCLESLKKDFTAGYSARNAAPSNQVLDVRMQDLTHDPIGTIRSIYRHFDIPYTDEFDARLQRTLRYDVTKRKVHLYSLNEYHLDEFRVRKQLGDYYDVFGSIL